MDTQSGARLDSADLGLIDELAKHARTELAQLAARLGMPERRVRERIRLLERCGIVRGYHAATSAEAEPGGCVLMLLRFTSIQRPSAEDLCTMVGVRRVHSLCTGWDFMLEVRGDAWFLPPGAPPHGEIRLLGARASFELLPILHLRTCPGVATPELQYEMPPA